MDLNGSSEGGRSTVFDIDLNEPPICSPREVAVAGNDATSGVSGEGGGKGKGKGKGVLLDMNALPSDAEGEDGSELVNNNGWHVQRRKESLIFSKTKDFQECQENLKSSLAGSLSFGIESSDVDAFVPRSDSRVMAVSSKETGISDSSPLKNGFPVQFEDFFILSLGKIDPRPFYHNTNQVWPVGYKSCWHDKITGSLFVCDVLDGGNSGPIFRVQRYPCSAQSIPIGSTLLYRPDCTIVDNKLDATLAADDEEDMNVHTMFLDNSPPLLDSNIFSDVGTNSNEIFNFQSADCCQRSNNSTSQNLGKLVPNNKILVDDIGEFMVEGRSSSSVWRKVSENLVSACHQSFLQNGICKFCCTHDAYWWQSPCGVENSEATEYTISLAKFCHRSGPVNIPQYIQCNNQHIASCETLMGWLNQDRFGLDVEFVQELIEHLPGIVYCSDYTLLNNRTQNSRLQTVEDGFLVVKRKSDAQGGKERDNMFSGCRDQINQVADNLFRKVSSPPGKPLSSRIPTYLIGDVLQSWELLCRFSEVLGLEKQLSFEELEEELICCYSSPLRSSCPSTSQHALVEEEGSLNSLSAGKILTTAHCSLLRVLLSELQSKLSALIDPSVETGESKSRKRRKKDSDNLIFPKKMMLDLLPMNELTWPELARRYILTLASMEGNLDSVEILNRDGCKVLRCLHGDTRALGGSPLGVAEMEADALLLAEATKQIFGSSKCINDNLCMVANEPDALGGNKNVTTNDLAIPDWAQVLEPVRKLPTNVGARIRKCVYEALERNPPDWAKKILEHSISKEVYKGNASGPTKKAVISLLADVCGENQQQKPIRKRKSKHSGTLSDVIMKQCQRVLRCAAAADEEKVFCNLLARTFLKSSDNDDEGFLGFATIVSHPLDFRTIDLRLTFGAYNGSHEAFLEDVRELWHHIRSAYADQDDLVCLAETLSKNFEALYEKEVLTLIQKFKDYTTIESLSSEAKKEIEDILEHSIEIPKAPWDEGVCKVCGVDKDDESVLLCDKCDSGYHTYCLNPPLGRIPEGNWYCPSCITGNCFTEGVTQVPQFSGHSQKKRCRGEFTHNFFEALAHLGTAMGLKDYWECSVEERIHLLKILGDELLNSPNIREHLDQCASVSAELQQKLRLLSTEWKNLKFKEELLAEKLAKMNANVHKGPGKSERVGTATSFLNYDRLSDRPLAGYSIHLSSSNGKLYFEDGVQQQVKSASCKQPYWILQDGASERNCANREGQFSWIPDTDYHGYQHYGMDAFLLEKSNYQVPPSCPQEKYDSDGEHAMQRSLSKVVQPASVSQGHLSTCINEFHMSKPDHAKHMSSEMLLPSEHGFIQPDVSESQAYSIEASTVRNKISLLQDSVALLESQLQKISLRKDFLGRDSSGRSYWAFLRPGSSPWVVVDGSVMLSQRRITKEHRKLFTNYFTFKSSRIEAEDSSRFNASIICDLCENGDTEGIPTSSVWFSYQSDAEIMELVSWLENNDPMGRELLNSIMLRLISPCKDSSKGENSFQDSCLPSSNPIRIEVSATSNAVPTKALSALEKKYGPFKPGVTDRQIASIETSFRCECLEALWPSRHHCNLCHCSFITISELNEHHDGKCNSDVHVTQKSKVSDGMVKGISMMRTEEGVCSDKTKLVNNFIKPAHENGSGLCMLPKDLASPYNIEEINAKFVMQSSNRELVEEIGLLGSNGIPSFITCASLYLSDPTLKLGPSWHHGVAEIERSISADRKLKLSVQEILMTDKKQINVSKNLSSSCTAIDLCSEGQTFETSTFIRGRRAHSSFNFIYTKSGNSVIRYSSMRSLSGKGAQILRQLKINLLDMDAALPKEARKPSKSGSEKACAWRTFVKRAKSVFEMVQATIVFEDMIKTEYLRNEWWYWSSLSAAAGIATVSSLALRIYTLDAAILYEKPSQSCSTGESLEVAIKSDNHTSVYADATGNQNTQNGKQISGAPSLDHSESNKPPSKSCKRRKDSVGVM